MNKLTTEIDAVLLNIASNGKKAMLKADIEALMNLGLITPKFGGGWMVNSKGRAYLKDNKISF